MRTFDYSENFSINVTQNLDFSKLYEVKNFQIATFSGQLFDAWHRGLQELHSVHIKMIFHPCFPNNHILWPENERKMFALSVQKGTLCKSSKNVFHGVQKYTFLPMLICRDRYLLIIFWKFVILKVETILHWMKNLLRETISRK